MILNDRRETCPEFSWATSYCFSSCEQSVNKYGVCGQNPNLTKI